MSQPPEVPTVEPAVPGGPAWRERLDHLLERVASRILKGVGGLTAGVIPGVTHPW
jgi:hypothetical protein